MGEGNTQKEKMAYHMFNQQLPPYLRVYAFIQSTGIHDWKTGSIKETQKYTQQHSEWDLNPKFTPHAHRKSVWSKY